MKVTRLDLDGNHAPAALVTRILKAEPGLAAPIPIEELAIQLDIQQIAELRTDGFEGGLITDEARGSGIILVRRGADPHRRRFTIGHELGHFLIPFHKPAKSGEFLCDREAMRAFSLKEQNQLKRMEAEANQFAALMLMPPPLLRPLLSRQRDPSLEGVLAVHEAFQVSKEAAARAYTDYHNEKIAIAIVKDSKLLRIYRRFDFPRLTVASGHAVPRTSRYHTPGLGRGTVSNIYEVGAEHWLETEFGKRMPTMYEQVLHQAAGFAMILLWIETVDEYEEEDKDENRTSKQRLQARLDRYRR